MSKITRAYPQRLFGKYRGVVVDNQSPDNRGRIRVRVSTILDEDQQPIEAWASPCFHPGFFFVPEVDANVWVEFEAGDINHPIWAGVWYPQGDEPDTAEGEAPAPEQKVVRTASGHTLTFDDDGASIVIVDSSGNKITLDGDGVVIEDKSNNQIVMDANGVKVVDKNSNEIDMQAGGVTIKSDFIKLGSDSATEPLVLGNQWLQLFNTHMHIGNMGAPTSPPAAAGTPAIPATHLSLKHKTE